MCDTNFRSLLLFIRIYAPQSLKAYNPTADLSRPSTRNSYSRLRGSDNTNIPLLLLFIHTCVSADYEQSPYNKFGPYFRTTVLLYGPMTFPLRTSVCSDYCRPTILRAYNCHCLNYCTPMVLLRSYGRYTLFGPTYDLTSRSTAPRAYRATLPHDCIKAYLPGIYRRYDTAIDGASILQSYGRPTTVLQLTVRLRHFGNPTQSLGSSTAVSISDRPTTAAYSPSNGRRTDHTNFSRQIFVSQRATDRLDEYFECQSDYSYLDVRQTDNTNFSLHNQIIRIRSDDGQTRQIF